jgi:hypothetical protein
MNATTNREEKYREAKWAAMAPCHSHVEGCKDCLGARKCRKGRRLSCAAMRAVEAITIR